MRPSVFQAPILAKNEQIIFSDRVDGPLSLKTSQISSAMRRNQDALLDEFDDSGKESGTNAN